MRISLFTCGAFAVSYGLALLGIDWLRIYVLHAFEAKWSQGENWAMSLAVLPFVGLLGAALFTFGASLADSERQVPVRAAIAGVALPAVSLATTQMGAEFASWFLWFLYILGPFAVGFAIASSTRAREAAL